MQINEFVNAVKAFPGVSSLCAFGCQSGRIGVFDSETNQFTYNYLDNKPVVAIDIDDENILYTADEFNILRHDHRVAKNPTLQIQTQSPIVDLAVYETSIAAATSDGIIVSDGRNFQKSEEKQAKISKIPPVKLHFLNKSTLLSGYADSSVTLWDFFSEEMTSLEIPLLLKNRKMKPFGLTSWTHKQVNTIAIGYESGISFYNDKKFTEHSSFDQRGHFGAFAAGPCFGPDYVISVIDGSSILPCGMENGAANPITLHGVNISSITSNHLMIVASDDDEEGYIAVLMPEAFGDQFY